MDPTFWQHAPQLGIGGLALAGFMYYVYFVTTKTLPDMIKDHKEAMSEKSKEFLDALKDQQETFVITLDKVEKKWEEAVDGIFGRLDRIDDDLDDLKNKIKP